MLTLPRLLALCLAFVLAFTAAAQSAKPAAADEPQVIGLELARAQGGYLGLNVEGLAFVLRFYDPEKKETAPDAIRVMARWNPPQKAGQQRTVLAPAGPLLRSPPVVRPPLSFVVFLTLIGRNEEVLETVSFNLRNLAAE